MYQPCQYGNCFIPSWKYRRLAPMIELTVWKSYSWTSCPARSAYALNELTPSGTQTGSQKCGTSKSARAISILQRSMSEPRPRDTRSADYHVPGRPGPLLTFESLAPEVVQVGAAEAPGPNAPG